MAIAVDGALYITDTGNRRVRILSRTGNVSTLPGSTGLKDPTQVAVGPGDVLYVNLPADRCVQVIRDGAARLFTQIDKPAALAAGPDGVLWVAGESAIYSVTPSGSSTLVAGERRTGRWRSRRHPVPIEIGDDEQVWQLRPMARWKHLHR